MFQQQILNHRCGSRTPDNPRWTWDSVCNCTGQGSGVGKGFLTKAQIKDMDATYRWETYDRKDKFGTTFNPLTDPKSKDFMALKRNIEARVSVFEETEIQVSILMSSLISKWQNLRLVKPRAL